MFTRDYQEAKKTLTDNTKIDQTSARSSVLIREVNKLLGARECQVARLLRQKLDTQRAGRLKV
jgi:hypothetical protein